MLTSEILRPFIWSVSDDVRNFLLPLRVLSFLSSSACILPKGYRSLTFINQGRQNEIKSGGAKQWLRRSHHGYLCLRFFLMFVKLSSCSNLIRHMFVFSLHVVHFITPFINRQSACYFFMKPIFVICLDFIHLVKWRILSNRIVFADTQL